MRKSTDIKEILNELNELHPTVLSESGLCDPVWAGGRWVHPETFQPIYASKELSDEKTNELLKQNPHFQWDDRLDNV
jgi:hypothetical protein